jgi:phosphoglycolate phosphatase-like HAD superfamily hydrolase
MVRMTLVLFDIDGTLLRSAGGGRRAMSMAAAERFGRPDLFDQVSFAGAVDSEVTQRALAAAGLPPTARRIGRLRATYGRRLRRALATRRGSVCPGVPEALSALQEVAVLGLVTGNWPEGARTKLEVYGLSRFFTDCVGAYGDDALDRNHLVPVAVRRARRRMDRVDRVVLVGDTPADVASARAGAEALGPGGPEVVAVAVSTGFAPIEALKASAPDLLLEDLASGLPELLGCV